MPFSRPSLTNLRTQAMNDITSSDLPNANGFLRRAVLRVLAWVQAGMAYLHYGYLDWIAQQGVPFTATDEFLDGWANLKLQNGRKAATAATGTWSGTGTNGTVLPSGTPIQRGDGFSYITTAAGTWFLAAPYPRHSRRPRPGADGNSDSGTPLTLGTVIAGINSAGFASAAITGGADQEADSALRTRMLQAYANPPQGGDASDYVEWALAVSGVTRAWCNPLGAGPGTVIVYTMFDITESGSGGFPQGTNGVATAETRASPATGDQLAVANYIFPLRPVTALVYSYAPTPQTLNFSIGGIPTGQQAATSAALTELLVQKGSPLANVSIDQSDVDAAITAVVGTTDFRVTAPSFPQTPTLGSLFVLGTVTYS